MIYIFCALYQEAAPLIKALGLKKDIGNAYFQTFQSEDDICLVITGTGSVSAATAVGCTCTRYGTGEGDLLLNVGSCAGIDFSQKDTEVFLCHKLIELMTGRTFYPDILYAHTMAEAELVTGNELYLAGHMMHVRENVIDGTLFDMEATAIYQAGAHFYGPHQMAFIKVISDLGDVWKVTPKYLEQLMERVVEPVTAYIEDWRTLWQQRAKKEFNVEECTMIQKLCEDLCCSVTMENEVWQYMRYLLVSGMDYKQYIIALYRDEKVPCQNRKEGKQIWATEKKKFVK